ncbi:MAG: OmpA family protein [Alphaproteobacteria bacterium]
MTVITMYFQKKHAFALIITGLLAACSAGQETGDRGSVFTAARNIDALKASPGQGSEFAQMLKKEYQRLADEEATVSRDYIDADFYAKKGLRAARGEEVAPERPIDWAIGSQRGTLDNARNRLVTALDNGGRTQEPRLSAFTQARYDCWVEQQEEAYQSEHISRCRTEFGALITKLEKALTAPPAPAPAPQPVYTQQIAPAPTPPPTVKVVQRQAERRLFVVLFDFDSSKLSNDAQEAVNYIAAKLRNWPQGKALVIGHADKAGTSRYNMALSQARAGRVMKALTTAGAPSDKVALTWAGEDDPAVPTADGTREQANRRVVVILDELGRR